MQATNHNIETAINFLESAGDCVEQFGIYYRVAENNTHDYLFLTRSEIADFGEDIDGLAERYERNNRYSDLLSGVPEHRCVPRHPSTDNEIGIAVSKLVMLGLDFAEVYGIEVEDARENAA